MALKGTKALEVWCQRVTSEYPNVKITNMTSSWRNGLGFCAVIHHHCPELINFSSLDQENVFDNNYLAFKVAEEQLGIPSLLDPKDMVECQTVDKLSILTYLAQYYKAMHNPAALRLRLQNSLQTRSSMDTDKQVNTAPGNLPKVNTVPGNLPKVNTAPGNLAKVITAPGNLPKVNTAPVNLHKVNTTPVNLPKDDTVPGNPPTVYTATGNPPKVNTALGNLPKVNTVPGSLPKVNTAPGNMPKVNIAPDNLPKVNTAPDNLPKVNTAPDNLSMDYTSPINPSMINRAPFTLPMVNTAPGNLPMVNTSPVDLTMVNTTPANLPTVNTIPGNLPNNNKNKTPVNLPKVNQIQVNLPMINESPVIHPNTTPDDTTMLNSSPNKTAMAKSGTVTSQQTDQSQCLVCSLPVYILERCSVSGATLHRACAKCVQCGDMLGVASMASKPAISRLGSGQISCKTCAAGKQEAQHDNANQNKERSGGESEESICIIASQPTHKPANSTHNLSSDYNLPPQLQQSMKAPPKPARTFQTKQMLTGLMNTTTCPITSSTCSGDALTSLGCKSKTVKKPNRDVDNNKNDGSEKKGDDTPKVANTYKSPKVLNQELFDLDVKITGMEKQGVKLERKIRTLLQAQGMNSDDIVLGPKEDDLILQLIDLVNEKNQLLRQHSEVIFTKREKRLEAHQEECEERVRVLLDMSAELKTRSDAMEEERLITKILEIVEERNEIVNCLEMDRRREIEEDFALLDIRINLSEQTLEDIKEIEKPTTKNPPRKKLMSLSSTRQ